MQRARDHPVGQALARSLGWLERLARRRLGALVLFLVALVDFSVQEAAWPVNVGKNLNEYLLTYVQLFDRRPLLPWAPLYRGPGTGVVLGPLLAFDGGLLVEAGAALMFALSVLAWARVAAYFGSRVAILTSAALLLYPGYGELFHMFASEIVMATAFSLWALAVTRACVKPSTGRFIVAGLALAAVILVRPGNAILVPFSLFPLLLRTEWRQRLVWTGGFAAAALLPLFVWALQNGWRYGDYTLARGGDAVVPFYRTFVVDKIVSPKNGPASRRLAAAIKHGLLTRQPYRAYHVTLDQVFTAGSNRVHEDLYALSDQVWGWGSAYSTLRDAAIEAIEAHPGAYASGVAHTIWNELSSPSYSRRNGGTTSAPAGATSPQTQTLPPQESGELIPPGEVAWISRPDQSIREAWASPNAPTFVVLKPKEKPRFEQIVHDLTTLNLNLPRRAGNDWLQIHLNKVSHWYPRPYLWLLLGLIVVPFRRPRGTKMLVMLTLAAAVSVLLDALGQGPQARYLLPVVPAFILFGAGALLGQKRRASIPGSPPPAAEPWGD
jgi:hypothetical protein